MTNGQVIRVRGALKPISTVPRALRTVDVSTGEQATANHQRSDTCAVAPGAVIAEAVVALTLAVLLVGTAVSLLAGLRGPALGTAVAGDPGLAGERGRCACGFAGRLGKLAVRQSASDEQRRHQQSGNRYRRQDLA